MSEIAQIATRLVVIGRGRLIADTTVDEFVARSSGNTVIVRSPDAARLRDLLLGPDVTVTNPAPEVLHVEGLTPEQVGTIAWQAHLPVYELAAERTSLEAAFMALTSDSVEFRASAAADTELVAP
jgi:ABC-2 type transport system ATP-binding protein